MVLSREELRLIKVGGRMCVWLGTGTGGWGLALGMGLSALASVPTPSKARRSGHVGGSVSLDKETFHLRQDWDQHKTPDSFDCRLWGRGISPK